MPMHYTVGGIKKCYECDPYVCLSVGVVSVACPNSTTVNFRATVTKEH